MKYLYENLGDERFQEFCSALISKEFPNIQAYPVGQPDGGRDTSVFFMDSPHKEFLVFQVKFVRNALEERDLHKWFTDVILKEAPKINKLIPKGAVRYYLITNVKGTAHIDSGSKDLVNKILEEHINVPSLCWWRDDIDTLFEKDPMFKWAYPQIINGQDILNSVLFDNINEHKVRREDAIRAYIVDQYELDNEVKFKQIDLKNKLLDLFTDVPIKVKKYNEKDKKLKHTFNILANHSNTVIINDYLTNIEDKPVIGAAEFILHPKVQKVVERMLLEGGPGQGKSTISQYVSQVHRVRLLNKTFELEILPESIKNTPIRLPFKIDLRHVASWLEEKNPYTETLNEVYFKNNWSRNLESFLVGHIFSHSKLEDFNSSDLVSVLKLSPVLLVFDGFDEIANIEMRGEVIEFINRGVARISNQAKSIQVIVTSRPAAFLDSEGFPVENYPHFELTDITNTTIDEYLGKWVKASDLNLADAKDLKKLVTEKLEMPHLKDLAKSPMQLAILISLLRTKGRSLPSKRTALYDSYIELFFDRESEKSSLILEQRDLIINIHQYLAWILHSEAEQFKNTGFLHINELRLKVKDFLTREGHNTAIADQLFDVMKERVCALVSRVQGTFEFEVQPLREYFCAKYLYKTAPHSSAGSVHSGSKPERFHSILRNFYWQNVVRFFAGCADRGELDMVIQELKDLQNDSLLKYTNYPRIITSQILSDYVFTQTPFKLKDVVKLIVDGINIGNIVNQKEKSSGNEPIILPIECGRNEIIDECFCQLQKFPNRDYASELIGIINNNPFDTAERWEKCLETLKSEDELTKWVEYGYKLQILYKVPENVIANLVSGDDATTNLKRLQYIIYGNRYDVIDKKIELKERVFDGILKSSLMVFDKRYEEFSLRFLTICFHPYIISHLFTKGYDPNLNLSGHLSRFSNDFFSRNVEIKLAEFEVKDAIDQKINDFKETIGDILNMPISVFKSSIEPWDEIVESARKFFGDNICLNIISIISANVKAKHETYDNFSNLHDSTISLCKRVRCARMKSGNISYWEDLLTQKIDIVFTLSVFLSWATLKTISQLIVILNDIVNKLNKADFDLICRILEYTTQHQVFLNTQQHRLESQLEKLPNNNKLVYLITFRFTDSYGQSFVYSNIKKNNKKYEDFNSTRLQYLLKEFARNPNNKAVLSEIKHVYPLSDTASDTRLLTTRYFDSLSMNYEIAKEIMADCKSYPRNIGVLAESSCRAYANSKLIPIGKIANDNLWFDD